ncbi:MAG: hypothetical protein PHT40_02485 [Patescibacteria group bacterium]|nr:hypothetical protein [Patescibacteria group bacterium]
MAYQSDFDRPMVQGNWTCADCGGTITQLKFDPRPGSTVYCPDCYKKNRSQRDGNRGGFGNDRGPKPKIQGNWTCSMCGVAVTELPFNPKDPSTVKCFDCYKQSRGR